MKKSKTKYEIIEVNNVELAVDVSLIANDEMFFNATQIAKTFSKRPNDFWNDSQNKKYLEALITITGGSKIDFVFTRKGKYGGTYLHKKLALQFARWCSAEFAVMLDLWIVERFSQEQNWQRERLAAKTGYLPMSIAVDEAHDPALFYHYATEANLLNKIILGMSAKQFKKAHGVDRVRDGLDAEQLQQFEKMQRVNTGLIEIGMDYQERKEHLESYFQRKLISN